MIRTQSLSNSLNSLYCNSYDMGALYRQHTTLCCMWGNRGHMWFLAWGTRTCGELPQLLPRTRTTSLQFHKTHGDSPQFPPRIHSTSLQFHTTNSMKLWWCVASSPVKFIYVGYFHLKHYVSLTFLKYNKTTIF